MDSRYARALYEAFIMAAVLSWLPFKSVNYISPFIVTAWIIFRANSGRTVVSAMAVFVTYILLVAFYWLLGKIVDTGYALQNSVFAFVTYGTFFFLVVLRAKVGVDENFYWKIVRVIRPLILIESVVGIFQFLARMVVQGGIRNNTGDAVQGTIYLFSFLESVDMGLGNQMYSINMCFMLMMALPAAVYYRKGHVTLILGFVSLILAATTHIIIPLILSIAMVFILFRQNIIGKLRYHHLFLFLTFIVVTVWVVRSQGELITYYFNNYIVNSESLKVRATVDAVTGLPSEYPTSVVVGLGPGQFSSRAALIGTGKYVGGIGTERSVLFKPVETPAYKEFILPLYTEYSTNPKYGLSTMSRPFSSALSLYAEFGAVFFLCAGAAVVIWIITLRKFFLRAVVERQRLGQFVAMACGALIIFMAIISFFENYLEVTQAIFPGLILVKLFYQSLKLRTLNTETADQ